MWAGSEAEALDHVPIEAQADKRHSRLVGVVDQLKRRLDVLRDENVQLESMLHAADVKVAGRIASATQLSSDVLHSLAGSLISLATCLIIA